MCYCKKLLAGILLGCKLRCNLSIRVWFSTMEPRQCQEECNEITCACEVSREEGVGGWWGGGSVQSMTGRNFKADILNSEFPDMPAGKERERERERERKLGSHGNSIPFHSALPRRHRSINSSRHLWQIERTRWNKPDRIVFLRRNCYYFRTRPPIVRSDQSGKFDYAKSIKLHGLEF